MHRKLAKREAEFLNEINASPTINSGATFEDADGIIVMENPFNDFGDTKISVEVKCTDNKSYSLKPEILKKLEKQARRIGTVPALAVDIQEDKYIVLNVRDFMAMLEYSVLLNNSRNFIDFLTDTNSEGDTRH